MNRKYLNDHFISISEVLVDKISGSEKLFVASLYRNIRINKYFHSNRIGPNEVSKISCQLKNSK